LTRFEPVAPLGQRRLEPRPAFLELGLYEWRYSEQVGLESGLGILQLDELDY
jgi:hypothetical protein